MQDKMNRRKLLYTYAVTYAGLGVAGIGSCAQRKCLDRAAEEITKRKAGRTRILPGSGN